MSSKDEKVLIKLEHVSKKFRMGQYIGPVAAIHKTKEIIARVLKRRSDAHPVVHERYEGAAEYRHIWALRDISLELRKGERVAILGRNGAGKSTLLKLIVGISTPTEGVITTHCRIVPLMGVGAGFSPELTGRENVYVYGGLLGVPASEIAEKYEDIVAFSEIPEFMDTPVKRYSKGMRARLGMAVALNLSPEVLVVDEVLAVGDVAFKKKCMDKMQSMCEAGMTLIFVSHSPARIEALCNRAVFLSKGELVMDGDTKSVLARYLEEYSEQKSTKRNDSQGSHQVCDIPTQVIWDEDSAKGDDVVKIISVKVVDSKGACRELYDIREDVHLEMIYCVGPGCPILRPQFQIYDSSHSVVFATIDTSMTWRTSPRANGRYTSTAKIPGNLLAPGTYFVGASVYTHTPLVKHARTGQVVYFKVYQPDVRDFTTAQSDYPRYLLGAFRPTLEWETKFGIE